MPGYSPRTTAQKLGLEAGAEACVLDAPRAYDLIAGPLPPELRVATRLEPGAAFIHGFFTDRARLAQALREAVEAMDRNGTFWVSWPKKASKVPTDLTEDVIRAEALPLGLVDVKVCAVDEVWSGLKLVIRRELR